MIVSALDVVALAAWFDAPCSIAHDAFALTVCALSDEGATQLPVTRKTRSAVTALPRHHDNLPWLKRLGASVPLTPRMQYDRTPVQTVARTACHTKTKGALCCRKAQRKIIQSAQW